MFYRASLLTILTVALALSSAVRGQDEEPAEPARVSAAPGGAISATKHPPLPPAVSEYWFVPDRAKGVETAASRFARGARLVADGSHAPGLQTVSSVDLAKSPLAAYADYYRAIALSGLTRAAEAESTLVRALDRDPVGYLAEAVPLRLAELAIARNDAKRAVELLDDLSDEKLLSPETVWLQLGKAAERAGNSETALKAYQTLYYEYPTSTEANEAQEGLTRLQTPDRLPADRYARELERAQKLYAARRWAQAKAAFEWLAKVARGDDRELVAMRIAQCDYHVNRYRPARDALARFLDDASREAEARFFHLSATRGLGDRATYVRLARGLVADHPDSTWAEETLNNLATHYITTDDDETADEVFRELLRRFPRSPHSERAAWKVGWRAYRAGNFRETAEIFERAAATFPRADYRPAWLYWSGRARVQLGDRDVAASRYAVTITDYQNSYYGRLAEKAAKADRKLSLPEPVRVSTRPRTDVPERMRTDGLIRELIAAGLFDDALREVQYAQRVWGDSPQLQATSAYIRHNQGLTLTAQERFNALRGAINTMRRAYPQFMAAGGEDLPPEVLRIIFPLDYWPLITKYAEAHDLDPFLLSALMAQESTFTPEIRSSANAIGLMQLIPGTGRRYATKLGIRNFRTSSLTQPETNVRLGTKYFKELIDRFGGAHYALASYNAGENRVSRWISERPPLPADEFTDDIPFPETQTYVKRILGTAEDYRRLYGTGLLDPNASLRVKGGAGAASR